ncbi:MAG TPA: protein-L-isoaspartate(D-aspartate) O-methyltransferase [Methylibium sp.]
MSGDAESDRASKFPLRLDSLTKPAQRASSTHKAAQPIAPATPQSTLRPQRPVHEAVQERARRATPAGLGLDSEGVRQRMVERLRAQGLAGVQVLAAMAAVPRHLFVDTALANQAYEDTSLPIGLSQTISKPSVVARMIDLMLAGRTAPLGRVLEVGTGCGYQAAVLARLARQVISVERLRPLHDKAREHLAQLPPLGLRNDGLRLVYGDGMLGHAPNAPYDGIIAAAGGGALPAAWLDQLGPGGRLVAPMHDAASGGHVLVVVDRDLAGNLQRSFHEAVHFVPLKSGVN